MHHFLKVFLVGCLFVMACSHEETSVYYIDNVSGNDSNSGLSPKEAWKSVANLSPSKLKPGDSVLFCGGMAYKGSIVLDSLIGNQGKPIVLASYGVGRAMVDAGDSAGILITHSKFVHFRNLIVNGSGRLSGNLGDGVSLQKCNYCKVDGLEVSGFLWSGLHVKGGSNIEIFNVYAHDNGFCGIYAESGENEYGLDGSKFRTFRNLHIARSFAGNNPGCPVVKDNHSGSGILIAGVVNGLIEHCEAMDNGWDMPREGNGPVGIWAYMSDSVVIRYCYSHHNKTSAKGKDGGGFDFDGGITNSVMQYNVAAFNEGAGYGIFQYAGATKWSNNIMCYNISYCDGAKNSKAGILMWYDPIALPMQNFHAFNNTIVSDHDFAVNFDPGSYENFQFDNNIFLITGTGRKFIGGEFKLAKFSNNLYWAIGNNAEGIPQPEVLYEKSPLVADPLLVLPDSGRYLKPEIGNFASWPFFRIGENSPCVGKGIKINHKVEKDFWGNAVSTNIGADNYNYN